MKVRELRDRLDAFDPDLDVMCYTEDESLVAPGHLFRLLEVENVDTVHGELTRTDDGVPSLKLGKGAASTNLVMLAVVADF